CVFAYSDLPYDKVMGIGAIVNSAGANFKLLGTKHTMIKSNKPVISVVATRTGTGKSQTSRVVVDAMLKIGQKARAIHRPMTYGDLVKERVQRLATVDDLKKHDCSIVEMEEYEPHVDCVYIIYAGVDYEAILEAAENGPDGCDVIL